jgi:GNAT superfamily N-acetyltransferase
LSALAFASKAHWGYDDAFMEACRDELTVRTADLARRYVRVADDQGSIVGFHGVEHEGREEVEISWLFVDPRVMGRGVGRALVTDALEYARGLGAARVRIEADPNAARFYERLGARRAGATPSGSIPGRVLPVYVIDVASKM